MLAKIQKWGNSLAVRIPTSFAKDCHLENGSDVNIVLDKGKLLVMPLEKKLTLDDLLAGITENNIHHEVDVGWQGKEDIE